MRRHIVATLIVAAVLLAACGAPARVETLDRTGDFGRVSAPLTHALPVGLSDVGVDGRRLVAGCMALEPRVAALVPDLGADGARAPRFVDHHCEWTGASRTALVVGMIDHGGAASDLGETILFIDHDRPVTGVGGRAVYDPETRTLYVIIGDRLWYMQLVGPAAGASALPTLVALGRLLTGAAATH
jgi:hypothetical protein